MGEIGDVFDGLSDPRRVNDQQHSLHDILVIALCTLLCGGETCTDMALFSRAKREFLESFLKLERGFPATIPFPGYSAAGPGGVSYLVSGIHEAICSRLPGSGGPGWQDPAPVLRPGGRRFAAAFGVNAWAAEQRLALGQLAVAGKSNEITAIPQLLKLLSLAGTVVTADAMHCQRQVAQQAVGQSADYVLALKGNQRTLHDDVRLFLEDPSHAGGRSHSGQQGSWPGRNPHRQCQR